MSEALQHLVERLGEVDGPVSLSRLLRVFADLYDVDNAIYYALSLGGERHGEEFGAMTYPAEWHARYEDVRYREVDPVVLASVQGFAPVDWRTLDWSGRTEKRLMSEASEFRVGNHGYSVPIHGPQGQFAMFSVSKHCRDDDWARKLSESAQDFLLIAHHVHRQALTVAGGPEIISVSALSPRERDVLTMIGAGKRRAQIADKLQISENTLRVYIDSARHKLGAVNTFHAVAIGVKTGLLKI